MLVIPVAFQRVYQSGYFVRKPDSIKGVLEDLYTDCPYPEDFMIEEIVIVDEEEWVNFHQDFFADKPYLDGKGGMDSTTATEELAAKYPAWTKSEREEYYRGAYRKCIAIFQGELKDLNLSVKRGFTIVDPQGYNYARYVALSEFYKEVNERYWKDLMEHMDLELYFYLVKQGIKASELQKTTADTVSEND
jgi:hypothetical protein